MKKQHKYIVTGIDTDAGKTVVSAVLAQKLSAAYWKPVQSGVLHDSDSKTIARLTKGLTIIPERYRLSQPLSPHAAARIDGLFISKEELKLPEIDGNLIIEGAGGLMVPFNDGGLTFLDLCKWWDLEIILVSKHYLGSINHTLLSAEVIKNSGLRLKGIVFVGDENPDSENAILKLSGSKMLGRIPWVRELSREFILEQSEAITL